MNLVAVLDFLQYNYGLPRVLWWLFTSEMIQKLLSGVIWISPTVISHALPDTRLLEAWERLVPKMIEFIQLLGDAIHRLEETLIPSK